jgi:hypothetical protein
LDTDSRPGCACVNRKWIVPRDSFTEIVEKITVASRLGDAL